MNSEPGAETIETSVSAPALEKTCRTCSEKKPTSDFKVRSARCRVCTNRDAAGRMDKLRRARGIPLFKDTPRPWLHKGMEYKGPVAIDEHGFRSCVYCKQRKHMSEFRSRKQGRMGIGSSCKACDEAKNREYVEKNRMKLNLKRYGITLEQYDEIVIEQAGRCAICLTAEVNGKGRFHVDHDHETGLIRGLLCNHCNWMLGHARDNTEIMRSAIRYLEKAQTASEVLANPE